MSEILYMKISTQKHSVFTAPDAHMRTSLGYYIMREREGGRETDRQTERQTKTQTDKKTRQCANH